MSPPRRCIVPVAADTAEALREIDEAIEQRGFRRDWTQPGSLIWHGEFRVAGNSYPVALKIHGLDFVHLPAIELLAPERLKKLTPHVAPDNTICYLEPTTALLDRYDPPGTVLYCLERAQKVFADALLGKSDQDFIAEFAAYWQGVVYVDLPPAFRERRAWVHWLALNDDVPDLRNAVISSKDCVAEALLARHTWLAGKVAPVLQPCVVAHLSSSLSVIEDAWPPDDLPTFIKWLAHFTDDAEAVVKETIAMDCNEKNLVLRAPNGTYVAEFVIPPAFQKPEFRARRQSFAGLALTIGNKISVKRYSGYHLDADYVYGRNMHGMANLTGKKIALIGCGTIGGFLAHALAESGAGAGGGHLHFFDRDTLQTANLGRHLLGIPYLGKPKAEGMRSFLTESLPHLSVEAFPIDISDQMERLLRYDLVLDATGEEALSIALNDFIVRRRPEAPPILFISLLGNGAAAEALMMCSPDHACFKCLKPELSKQPRYRVLRGEQETNVVRNMACGDAAYIPFPVSSSMQAAALALEMALDWVNGHPRPYFRVRTFDEQRAFHVKDANPDRSPRCPACGEP